MDMASARNVMLPLLLALSQACGPDPSICVTNAGMRASGDGLDCDLLRHSEDITLRMLGIQPKDVRGWSMSAIADEKFRDPYNRYPYVGGLIYCDRGYIVIGSMLKGMRANGYVHEMAHLRECRVMDPDDPHALWGEPKDDLSVWSEIGRVQDAICDDVNVPDVGV